MRRLNNIKMTEAMGIDTQAKELSKTKKIYNLSAGDPNIQLQDELIDSYYILDVNRTKNYCSSQGLIELRKLIHPNTNQVMISNGAKQLIYLALRVATNPSDEVVIIGPCWPSYMRICDILGIKYTLVVGDEKNNYIPTASDIEEAITDKTAAILINNPNNPTGVVYDDWVIDKLLDEANKHDCYLISDEIYKDIIFDERKFYSLRKYVGKSERVIVIDGFSKSCSVTGWRIGYAIASDNVISAMTNFQSQISGPPSTLAQKLIYECYEKLKSNPNIYKERVDAIDSLNSIFRRHKPDGGFYYYIPIAEHWRNSDECCKTMLVKHGIALTPGDEYGVERTVRISIASIDLDDLNEIKQHLSKI